MPRGYGDEFPLLADLGLYAADILGDGNCLFNALSDQIYGNQDEHLAIRSRVIDWMIEHKDYFKQFLDVQPGGGTRRNPKRKNTGSYNSQVNYAGPTEDDVSQAFDAHILRMKKGGTWGDNMEIVAFAAAFHTDVRIYMTEYSYMIPGQGDEASRKIAHIAYHDWEHYSSIRNLDGPHSGLPAVAWKAISPEDQQGGQAPKKPEYAAEWKIHTVKQSLPFLTDPQVIARALEDCKGNVDNAVSMLMDADQEGSVSSTQGSSSIERDQDSDDEGIYGPNKRANHSRQRRAARNAMRVRGQERRDMAARLAQNDGSQESVSQGISSLEIPDSQANSPRVTLADDEEWTPDKSDGIATPDPTNRPVRLKINVPEKPSDGKTSLRLSGPRARPLSARERKEQKKSQQKAARKVRAQQAAKGQLSGAGKDNLPILTKPKAATPVVEGGMRTLYI
ncbi:hypothetical protein BLS_009222 [Venturia inaequalis]|uniref:OTU domain-containing protein n=1 Tax=Venturia inaequalis TaxID=5025 RepID=A0A8H3U405_VENIN|nr:hypothetical protein EG328_011850 [Venturia inaequalis]KAE9980040.1 hypothetical protein BLS_009222 [Venturia inaequalis]KAE9987654.1 hypothetical protein EG327_003691 [Venturia inaequalis]RDI80609.1 mRNA cleavage and polyadenylation factor [Venturia inaequalis]